MEVTKTALGELCLKTCSGGTPKSTERSFYEPATIPWLTTSEVNYSRIYSTKKGISVDGLNNSSAKLIPENSVIVAMYGQGNTAGRVAINKIPLSTNQACCNLIIDPTKADYKYVYYALCASYDKLVALKNGGAQPNLNATKVKSFEIPTPTIEVQRAIGRILSAYDDMIDNCKRQITLLEEAAQRLYREWFVDMRFPGYETTSIMENGLPEGWQKMEIFPFFKTVLGGTPSRNNPDYWNGSIPWINSGAVNLDRITVGSEYITELAVTRTATKLMPKHTTLLAITGATLGQVSFTEISCCGNQSVIGIIPPRAEFDEYLHLLITDEIEHIISPAGGSAQQHINKDILNKYLVTIPSECVLVGFHNLLEPYYDKISRLYSIHNYCKEAKSSILPRLFSGQIEINA